MTVPPTVVALGFNVQRALAGGIRMGVLVMAVLLAVVSVMDGGAGCYVPVLLFQARATAGQPLAAGVVLAAGLCVDALGGGPLGAWGLAYGVSALMAQRWSASARVDPLVHAGALLACLLAAASVQTVLILVFSSTLPAAREIVLPIAIAVVIYPAVYLSVRLTTVARTVDGLGGHA